MSAILTPWHVLPPVSYLPYVVFAAITAVTQPSLAGTIFETGFEPPTYTTGLLAGQDGWGAAIDPEVIVQDSVVFSGSQAVQIAAAGLTSQTSGQRVLSYVATGTPEPIVHLEVDFQVSDSGTPSTWTALSAFGGGLFLGQIWVRTNGTAAIGAGMGFGSVPVARGVWNHFELVLNFDAQTQSAYYNGQLIAENVPFVNAATTLNRVGFSMNSNPGTDIGYWDNYSVVSAAAIPEPAAFWVLAPALAGLLLIRQRTASHFSSHTDNHLTSSTCSTRGRVAE